MGPVAAHGGARAGVRGGLLHVVQRDDEDPVPAFQTQVLDVGTGGRLRYPKPVEGEQGDQGVLGRLAKTGGDSEGADLVPVQDGGVGLVVHPGTPDVRGWRMVEESASAGLARPQSAIACGLDREHSSLSGSMMRQNVRELRTDHVFLYDDKHRAHDGDVPGACDRHTLATWMKNGE